MFAARWLGLALVVMLVTVATGCGPDACDSLDTVCPKCSHPSVKTVCEVSVVDGDPDTCQSVLDQIEQNGC